VLGELEGLLTRFLPRTHGVRILDPDFEEKGRFQAS
jgi:hypothetical protein